LVPLVIFKYNYYFIVFYSLIKGLEAYRRKYKSLILPRTNFLVNVVHKNDLKSNEGYKIAQTTFTRPAP